MKFFIILSAFAAVAIAKPGHVLLEPGQSVAHVASPLVYASPNVHVKIVPGAPIGHDGRVVDTPEVAHEKAQHHAAHINEKVALARETVKSADVVAYSSLPAVSYQALPVHAAVAPLAYAKLVPGAPIGLDGRVVDTPEVAHLKAEHAAAHINQKVALAHEEAKSSDYVTPHVKLVSGYVPVYQKNAAALVSVW